MTTVNPLKNSNGRSSPKKSYSNGSSNRALLPYLFPMVTASLLTTYSELWFTARGYYTFLARPYPSTFPIDIRFALIVIPTFTFFALWMMKATNRLNRIVFIMSGGLVAMLGEPLMAEAGWVVFSSEWNHIYSFFGYAAFLILIRWTHVWTSGLYEKR